MHSRFMKPSRFAAFVLPIALALGSARAASADPAAAPASDQPVLALVVVDTLVRHDSAFTDFDRLDLAFQEVARDRHWPVRIAAERFAANTGSHELELRVFLQPIRQDIPDEFTFRSWIILTEHGTKHDFGVIVYRYRPRPGEMMDDALEKIFRGAATAAAAKIEPVLFPELAKPKS